MLLNANRHITNKRAHIISGLPSTNLKCYLINITIRKVWIYYVILEDIRYVLTLEIELYLTRKEK